jgi:hypothetical protein
MRVDNNTRNRCVFRKPAFVLAATVSIGLGTFHRAPRSLAITPIWLTSILQCASQGVSAGEAYVAMRL